MKIIAVKMKFSAPWVHSLKEKRMLLRSILQKTAHKFTITPVEVDDMDIHHSIVIGFAVVSNSLAHATQMKNTIISFIEANMEANLMQVDYDEYAL